MLRQFAVALIESQEYLFQNLERRTPVHLQQNVAPRRRDVHQVADGTAALRDHCVYLHISLKGYTHNSTGMRLIAKIQRVATLMVRAARQSANLRAVRKGVIQPHQQLFALHAERVCKDEEGHLRADGRIHESSPLIRRRIPVRQRAVLNVKRSQADTGQVCRRKSQTRPVLHLSCRANHAAPAAPHKQRIAETLRCKPSQRLIVRRIVGRHEGNDHMRRQLAKFVLQSRRALVERFGKRRSLRYSRTPLHSVPSSF